MAEAAEGRKRRSGPTIRDVAAAAGVSKSLVSMVFNDDPRVSEHRRQRVLDAAEQLGFRLNWMARSFAAGDGDFVAVMVPDLANPVFAEILESIRGELRAQGRRALLSNALYTDEQGRERFDAQVVTVVQDMYPSALVIIGSAMPSLEVIRPLTQTTPTVVASGVVPGLDNVRVVRNDDRAGIGLLLDHLTGLGHRSITFLGGQAGEVADDRRHAFLSLMAERGLGDSAAVAPSDYSIAGAAAATGRLLDTGARPSAILAVNDLAAIGAIDTLEAAGLRVPEDVAVTGYDDTFLAGIGRISLTTIDPRNAEIGREAAGFLVGASGAFEGFEERLLQPRLVVRRSSGAGR